MGGGERGIGRCSSSSGGTRWQSRTLAQDLAPIPNTRQVPATTDAPVASGSTTIVERGRHILRNPTNSTLLLIYHRRMRYFSLSLLLLLIILVAVDLAVTGAVDGWGSKKIKDDDDENEPILSYLDQGYNELVAWVKSHGGRVNERMGIGLMDSLRGVIALEDIDEGTELLHCPWELVIGSSGLENQMETEEDMCHVIKIMAAEYRLLEESIGWPYLGHIELPRLGAMWEQAAVDELQGLAPSQDIDRHLQWFSQNCGGGDKIGDEATMKALVAFITRANQVGMTPIYDLLNHHNGLKNAKLFLHNDGVDLRTVQPVSKGQQLYLSYGLKTSSQMFRDYGFVEEWPSLWSWKDADTHDNHVFAHFGDGFVAIHPSPEFLKTIWNSSSSPPPPKSLAEYQTSADEYTQSLDPDSLLRFSVAARAFLERLPTTVREDEAILAQTQERRLSMNGDSSTGSSQSTIGMDDIIAAVQYRLTFKRAVLEAMTASNNVIRSRLEKDL